MKYGRTKVWRKQYPVAVMCHVFDVSESGYHALRSPPVTKCTRECSPWSRFRRRTQRTREPCCPERLQSDLAEHGIRVGVDRIKRIRKNLGLHCKQKRKFKVNTDSKHNLPAAPNLQDRNFTVLASNRAWVNDIAYIPTFIEIFNNRQRKQARLGYLSPAAFTQRYYEKKLAA